MAPGQNARLPVNPGTDKSFLVLFFKKAQKAVSLLFEKRSKNFFLFGARGAARSRGHDKALLAYIATSQHRY